MKRLLCDRATTPSFSNFIFGKILTVIVVFIILFFWKVFQTPQLLSGMPTETQGAVQIGGKCWHTHTTFLPMYLSFAITGVV